MAWQSRYKVIKLTAPVWLLWGAGLAALMLLVAHGFELIGHLAPCELCLGQRDVYWGALAEGGGGYALARWRPRWGRTLLLLLAAIFAGETVFALYHAGVEWRWWPGPASCTGVHSGPLTVAQMSSLLTGPKHHVVQCDQAAWRMFGLSMAGWNALAALALTVATLVAYRRVKVPR